MPPNDTYYAGAVDTDTRVSNIQPEEWFPTIKKLQLMRTAPITAILNATGSETTRSRKFHWWQHDELKTYGSVTDVYTDVALSSAYSSGGVVGSILYVKMAEEDANIMHEGDGLTFNETTNHNSIAAEVVSLVRNGANSYAAIRLLAADSDTVLAASTLYYTLQSSAMPEGSELPEADHRDPEESSNCTQITMQALEMTGTEMEELERVSPSKAQRDRMDALAKMLRKQEEAILFGEYYWGSKNGKPFRRTRGMYAAIRDNESGNIKNYITDSAYSGQSWEKGGLKWLEDLSVSFSLRGENKDKLLYTGLHQIKMINRAIRYSTYYTINEAITKYGIKVFQITGLAQNWTLIPHPHFTDHPARQTWGFLTEKGLMKKVTFRNRGLKYVRPRTANDDGYVWVDGIKHGWVEEWGLMYNNLPSQGFLKGIGSANAA